MKYVVFYLLLQFGQVFSQNLEKKVTEDVIFVLFEEKDAFQKKKNCNENLKAMKSCWYSFTFLEENKYSFQDERMNLIYQEFKDFDEMEKNNPVPVFTIDKSFLKKNKNIIVTRKLMHKKGYLKTIDLFRKAKTIYLIEKKIDEKKIVLKEVRLLKKQIE